MRIVTYTKTLIVIGIVLAGAYGAHWFALRQFELAYRDYAIIAERHDEVAAIPALTENPLRRDLNRALAGALAEGASEEERNARAREGLALLVLAEGAIDAIGEVGEDAMSAILEMEARASLLGALNATGEERRIIALAHRRYAIIADIRGLSYRSNHHTKEIFDRIIADGGALTAEHALALDRLIPDVEEQFNRRANLYTELKTVNAELAAEFRAFEGAW